MATRIGSINRAFFTPFAALTEYLVCSIPNGDAKRQVAINHINYGYTSDNAAPTAFGWGGIHVIQGRVFQDGVLGYFQRFPDPFLAQGSELYFDGCIAYGSQRIDFKTPIVAEPALDVILVMPAPIAVGGVIIANSYGYMSIQGEYLSVKDVNIAGLTTR